MRYLEIEGKNIDEAIEKACSEFNVPREKLNIEIISDGTTGFLGILGSKKAKIKASLLSSMYLTGEDAPEKLPVNKNTNIGKEAGSAAPVKPSGESENTDVINAKKILEGILERMNVSCPVTAKEMDDMILLEIQGDGSGLLIGKRGQNLDAIQYIVNKASNKAANNRKMIVIDTEGYRKRRKESLIALAANLAEKVKKTKKSITLSHLNAHDRRIIHLALQNEELLTTKSRGEGDYRKIVIMPNQKR